MEELYDLNGGRELGRGFGGIVRVCRRRSTGREYACKSVSKEDAQRLAHARTEVAFLEKLRGHPNIVTLEAHFEDQAALHTVMELCDGGDLFEHLGKQRQPGRNWPLQEAQAAEIFGAVLKAACFCHQRGIMHRDIKLENLLLPHRSSRYSELKLADFGLAADFSSGRKLFRDRHGTAPYTAPEILWRQPYDQRADVWSMGVLLYVLLCGYYPFPGNTFRDVRHAMTTQPLDLHRYHPWPVISFQAKDLLSKMLQPDPWRRCKLSYLLNHPWLQMNRVARPISSPGKKPRTWPGRGGGAHQQIISHATPKTDAKGQPYGCDAFLNVAFCNIRLSSKAFCADVSQHQNTGPDQVGLCSGVTRAVSFKAREHVGGQQVIRA